MKLLVLAVLVALATAHFEYTKEFQEWKDKYNRKYETKEIELQRQIIWESNKKFVENHNANTDKLGFTVAMNEYADLDAAEFDNIYNGLLPRPANYSSPNVFKATGVKVDDTVDWRQKGAVTGIKNQGKCGSCWSFSATGSLEGQCFLKTDRLVPLSEQQLMDCSTKFGDHSCKGGLMDNAFRYLETVAGDESEEDYPYTAETHLFCEYRSSRAVCGLTGYKDIPRGNEEALKEAVATVGPISCAIDAGHSSFQLYRQGVYYNPTCSSTKLDHGILVVGYGTYMGEAYWLVKNSWGPHWGMEGYIMMSRNRENNCGIATQASYPTGVHAAH